MAQGIFGDNERKMEGPDTKGNSAVVSWVMSRVDHGREQRDLKHKARWEEYTRLHRGMWDTKDKSTDSERSKLIAPALQQAIEMTVAEMDEAVFGRTAWFGTEDDDNAPEDVLAMRDNLLYDFDQLGVEDAISRTFLLGAIYGTGIAKVHVVRHRSFSTGPDGRGSFTEAPRVKVEAVRPDEFVIDPSATNVDEAMFCAHEFVKPIHGIKEKQARGIYIKGNISPWSGNTGKNTDGGNTTSLQPDDGGVMITEYYGKVPSRLLKGGEGKAGMKEAIVTIANANTLLKIVENPFTMKDRPIVAYQHDTVPGEFWGRGVAEKGYNPQKALDSELRARIDALALMTAPMMGADMTRLGDRYAEFTVRPGKTVFTRGRPSEIYEPVAFGNPAQLGATFQHTGDLERMVQMGTGAMDSAVSTAGNARNSTVGGMSQVQSGFLKRAKRTMSNVERQFLDPLVRKSLWRMAQFDPKRYPGGDYEFRVHTALGITAKEVENANLTQMLGFTQPGEPARNLIIAALFENTVSSNKKALMDAVKAMNKQPSEEEQKEAAEMQALQKRAAQLEVGLKEAELAKLASEKLLIDEKARHERIVADLEDEKMDVQMANAATAAQKTRVTARQVEGQMDRNEIDREKVRKLPDVPDGHPPRKS
jgi:hypothetical protein